MIIELITLVGNNGSIGLQFRVFLDGILLGKRFRCQKYGR